MKKILVLLLVLLSCTPVLAQQVPGLQTVTPLSPGATVSISVTSAASAATALGLTFTPASNSGAQVMVTNTGSNTAFITFGGSTVAATTSGIPIPAGVVEVFTVNQYMTYVSAITASSTTTVYFTVGIGN